MVKIPVFEVEQWMDTYETTPGVLNIAETCARSISITELLALHTENKDKNNSGSSAASAIFDLSTPLTYGAIRGSDALRQNIAALYADADEDKSSRAATVTPDDVIVTQGAIAANHLVFYSLVGPGDHVVCVFPTYQQLYAVPETLGAEVSLWRLRAEDRYVPDASELEKLIRSNTKVRISCFLILPLFSFYINSFLPPILFLIDSSFILRILLLRLLHLTCFASINPIYL